MESYLHCVEPIRSNKRASHLEDSKSSIKRALKRELETRSGVDKEKLSQRPTFVAFELPAVLLPGLTPSFGSKLHKRMEELILTEITKAVPDKKEKAKLERTLHKRLPRGVHWLSCRPEPTDEDDLEDDEEGIEPPGPSTAYPAFLHYILNSILFFHIGSKSRSLKRKRSQRDSVKSDSSNLLDQITTLVIGQVTAGLHAVEPGGSYPKALLLNEVNRIVDQLGLQVNISNGKNSPAHVAGNALFGNLRQALEGPPST